MFLLVLACALIIPCILFFVATKYVDTANRQLIGQLGGPIVAALTALFAAYVAFSGIQTQLALQQRAFNFSRAEVISSRIGRLVEFEKAVHKLQILIDSDLQVPFAMGELTANVEQGLRDRRTETFKASLNRMMTEMEGLEARSAGMVLGQETQKALSAFFSTIRDLEYALKIAFFEFQRGTDILPTNKPELGHKFAKCQDDEAAVRSALVNAISELQRQHDDLV